jgi:Flp pilus assembly protein TadD
MTMVGSSFTRAWQKGAEEYRDWSAKGKLNIVETQKAWEQFKPATLPHTNFPAAKVSREDIEAKFADELETLARQRLAILSAAYLTALGKRPDDAATLIQLGILYGENGLYAEALDLFRKITASDNNNAIALNDAGNILFLQDRLEDAKAGYEAAIRAEPGDAGISANLARVLLAMGKKKEAKKLFQDAAANDPRVIRTYGDLAADVGIAK